MRVWVWAKQQWVISIPAAWVTVTLLGYAGLLAALAANDALDWSNTLSGAQAFAGLAGFGAGAVAIIGLARQLQSPRPDLRLEHSERDGLHDFVLHNAGNVAAEGLVLSFSPAAGVKWGANDGKWTGFTVEETYEMRREKPFAPNARLVVAGMTLAPTMTVTLSADNASPVSWRAMESNDEIRVEVHEQATVTRLGDADDTPN